MQFSGMETYCRPFLTEAKIPKGGFPMTKNRGNGESAMILSRHTASSITLRRMTYYDGTND